LVSPPRGGFEWDARVEARLRVHHVAAYMAGDGRKLRRLTLSARRRARLKIGPRVVLRLAYDHCSVLCPLIEPADLEHDHELGLRGHTHRRRVGSTNLPNTDRLDLRRLSAPYRGEDADHR